MIHTESDRKKREAIRSRPEPREEDKKEIIWMKILSGKWVVQATYQTFQFWGSTQEDDTLAVNQDEDKLKKI